MVLHLKRNTALKYMGKEEPKKRYIIEIKYSDDKVEELDISTDDIEWSMEQYKRNRPPLDWKIKFEYSDI